MHQAPDRKKLRRKYLWKKAIAYLEPVILTGFILAALCKMFLFPHEPRPWGAERFINAGMILVFLFFAIIRGLRQSRLRASRIAYIPPVTPTTLSANETLVLGSEAPPVAQSEVLLRAAKEVEAPKEELLRVTATADMRGDSWST